MSTKGGSEPMQKGIQIKDILKSRNKTVGFFFLKNTGELRFISLRKRERDKNPQQDSGIVGYYSADYIPLLSFTSNM
jgi:hypothetical protein